MLEAIEHLPLAQFLRRDIYAYPLVNTLHILALGALFTSVALMDLRVLGLGRRLSLVPVIETLRPIAIGAVVLAVFTGAMLFSVQPLSYAANPVFWTKMALLALALANAAYFVFAQRHLTPRSAVTRISAGLSMLLWIGVVVAGRAIGYFGAE